MNYYQTFGGNFESDGRPQGSLDIQTVTCDTTTNTCQIKVPAPGFALVFLNDAVLSEVTPQSPQTFATTAYTRKTHIATIDPSVLATSNGHSGSSRGPLMNTSKGALGNTGSAGRAGPAGSVLMILAVVLGAAMVRAAH